MLNPQTKPSIVGSHILGLSAKITLKASDTNGITRILLIAVHPHCSVIVLRHWALFFPRVCGCLRDESAGHMFVLRFCMEFVTTECVSSAGLRSCC